MDQYFWKNFIYLIIIIIIIIIIVIKIKKMSVLFLRSS